MTWMTLLATALVGGTWGGGLAWLLLRASLQRQDRAAEALQRGMADLQGRCWTLEQHLVRPEAAPPALPESENTGGALDRLYERAIRMARGGAKPEELMHACGLTQAEAELVARLHVAPDAPMVRGAGA